MPIQINFILYIVFEHFFSTFNSHVLIEVFLQVRLRAVKQNYCMKLLGLLILFIFCGTSGLKALVNDTIKVKAGNTFEIKLITNMGTGYSWSITDSAYSANMSLDSVTVANNYEGKDNGSDLQVFHMKALTRGETKLHFVRRRPWEKNTKPEEEKTFAIIIE